MKTVLHLPPVLYRTLAGAVLAMGLSAGATAADTDEDAAADRRPVALVEFASFDCQFCQAMDAHHAAIETAAEKAEIEYRYAPLPSDTNLERAWRERTYYASREIPGISQDVREAFLTAGKTGVPLDNLDEVLALLQLNVPQVRWNQFSEDRIQDRSSAEAIERAIQLAGRAGLRKYPAFAVVSHSGVELLSLPSDVDEKAEAVITYLENL